MLYRWPSLFAVFLSANSLIHISILVKNDNFLVKNGLFICEFKIRGPKWRNVSTANYEGNLYWKSAFLTRKITPQNNELGKLILFFLQKKVPDNSFNLLSSFCYSSIKVRIFWYSSPCERSNCPARGNMGTLLPSPPDVIVCHYTISLNRKL